MPRSFTCLLVFAASFSFGCSDRSAYDAAVVKYHQQVAELERLTAERDDAAKALDEELADVRQRFMQAGSGDDPVMRKLALDLAAKSVADRREAGERSLYDLDVGISIQQRFVESAKEAMDDLN